MREKQGLTHAGITARVYACNTAIVGTGAAGYNAACRLWKLGQRDMVLVTENRLSGTSRNTGSDKQTYYKLTLSGREPDSVREMADTLFRGECVDGDLALCEAALSTQCFFRLTELGVPFPRGTYGEYVGYKTDHDPRQRATSVGPYTSRKMTECLEKEAESLAVPLLNHMQVIRILAAEGTVCGLLCLDTKAADAESRYVLIRAKNVVWATGGPAGIYRDSVYPTSQFGATGLALEAGAKGKNLTEWQYGLASVKPRWNVSGTYMQVLPRVFSVGEDGAEREFLSDFFEKPEEMLSLLFLKGYQWPFDVRKVDGGSSVIDILVYLETEKGRRVYLDYRQNPACGVPFSKLSEEAYTYLDRAGACFGTPIERLLHMNEPAVAFYREHGVDLSKEPLEIALSAQHQNGGLAIDCRWQTDVKGLFVIGEAAASHGVYRPGGSALNAGQVGSTRAAQYIAARCQGSAPEDFVTCAENALEELCVPAESCIGGESNVRELWDRLTGEMSRAGAAFRDREEIDAVLSEGQELFRSFFRKVRARETERALLYRLRDMLLCRNACLYAMSDYRKEGGRSRGSALYTDLSAGKKPYAALPDRFTFLLDQGAFADRVQEISLAGGQLRADWRRVRPVPEEDDFFENVWRSFRENGNFS